MPHVKMHYFTFELKAKSVALVQPVACLPTRSCLSKQKVENIGLRKPIFLLHLYDHSVHFPISLWT